MKGKCYCSKKNEDRILSEIGKLEEKYPNGFYFEDLNRALRDKIKRRTLYYCLTKLKNKGRIVKLAHGRYLQVKDFLRYLISYILSENPNWLKVDENRLITQNYVYNLLMHSRDIPEYQKYILKKFDDQVKDLLSRALELPLIIVRTKYNVDALPDKDLRGKFIDALRFELLQPYILKPYIENMAENMEELKAEIQNNLKLAINLKKVTVEILEDTDKGYFESRKVLDTIIKYLDNIIDSRVNGKHKQGF